MKTPRMEKIFGQIKDGEKKMKDEFDLKYLLRGIEYIRIQQKRIMKQLQIQEDNLTREQYREITLTEGQIQQVIER